MSTNNNRSNEKQQYKVKPQRTTFLGSFDADDWNNFHKVFTITSTSTYSHYPISTVGSSGSMQHNSPSHGSPVSPISQSRIY